MKPSSHKKKTFFFFNLWKKENFKYEFPNLGSGFPEMIL